MDNRRELLLLSIQGRGSSHRRAEPSGHNLVQVHSPCRALLQQDDFGWNGIALERLTGQETGFYFLPVNL